MKPLFPTAALLALSACTSLTPQLDAQFGHSVMLARSQQTIDPAAASKAGAPTGIDGQAAHSAYGRYQESFRSPPPAQPLLSIGIGTATGGK